jgi:hypothetical protein
MKDISGSQYHIKVQGNLDPRWADWFEGFTLTTRSERETLLSGRVADQAALHGVLEKINRLGLSLLLVVQVEPLDTGGHCPLCGHPGRFEL